MAWKSVKFCYHSLVNVTRVWAEQLRNQMSITGRARDFSPLHRIHYPERLYGPSSLLSNGLQGLFLQW
jgi:hypothetical protein